MVAIVALVLAFLLSLTITSAMRAFISTMAAIILLYGSAAGANDLEDAVLAQALNCMRTYVSSILPTDLSGIAHMQP
jgi:hypothetical protein